MAKTIRQRLKEVQGYPRGEQGYLEPRNKTGPRTLLERVPQSVREIGEERGVDYTPLPLAKTPDPVVVAAQQADMEREQDEKRRRRGLRANIFAGAEGVLAAPQIRRRALLGT